MPTADYDAGARIAIAMLIGMGVGLEREWSGQATGANARFAGLRTFLLLGLSGGIGGLLIASSNEVAGTAIIACAMAFAIVAYVMATRRLGSDVGGTTEVAALAVVALGAVAGLGWLLVAAGAGSLMVLALSEKTRLHWFVGRVSESELRATLEFAVFALVVLPLLPAGSYGGRLAIQPRAVWIIVLMFSGLSFIAYVLRRALGAQSGYIVTGLAGGLVSSTAVTLEFSRRSRLDPSDGAALAFGVIGSCTVLVPRVIIVSALLSVAVAMRLAQLLWPPMLLGAFVTFLGWVYRKPRAAEQPPEVRNPLRLGTAIQLALIFQAAVSTIALVQAHWGAPGVYATASVLGLTDVDALTMSMSRLNDGLTPGIAATAITIGITVNTLMKLVTSIVFGATSFRRIAVPGLIGLGVATGLVLVL